MTYKNEDYYDEDGKPFKCYKCKGTNIKSEAKDTIANTVCEAEYYCGDCLAKLAYWSYGHFQKDESLYVF